MDDLKQSTADLAGRNDGFAGKETVEEVVDEIKYALPVSKDFLKPLEAKISDEIQQLKDSIESGKNEETLELCKVLF